MADLELRSWRLRSGPYLGEISALSFLHLPSSVSSFPLLLAGTGSQILVYDIEFGKLINSFQVFEGVRVHGVALRSSQPKETPFSMAVFGERRVKLFLLRLEDGVRVTMELDQRLPGFDHWVLDVCFLEEDEILGVGLSDNSVALWDLKARSLLSRVKSPEKCLLYSLRMWGCSIRDLLVASGTIYNEILIWKLIPQVSLSSSSFLVDSGNSTMGSHESVPFHRQQYATIHLSRLTGHEGSIFRLAWSADGSKLMSVSDDRCARIWLLSGQIKDCNRFEEIQGLHVIEQSALFGHNARIWDCYISDNTVITAGEDCTCRVWEIDGNQIMMFKEHIGRGIWRCLYDPSSSLLITAGFDSAIKVHQICLSSSKEKTEYKVMSNELKHFTEIFPISAPKVSKQLDLMDSKSEYVRCLHFTQENILFVATNNGHLHHAKFSNSKDVRWTEVVQINEEAPIICMDIISLHSKFSLHSEDIIALGDGKGNVTIARVINGDATPEVSSFFTWSAEKERQLLGVYWCKSLGCRHLFTADPRGVLKLWNIGDALQADAHDATRSYKLTLIAVFESCFGARVMCIDASSKDEILVCGDKRGNIAVFPLSEGLLSTDCRKTQEKIPLLDRFKGAHGISSVNSVCIGISNLDHVEIHTTGGDGCICLFKYGKKTQKVEFVGIKQVKELSTIQSVFANFISMGDLALGNYVIGFTAADFIVWNLKTETKTLQIPCGGWRRPFSYFLGTVPESQNCFAYVKDHTIHIHKIWVPDHERKLFPLALHMQYHGREVHSVCFLACKWQPNPMENLYTWIATGCEDGTVRLARYSPTGAGTWHESKLLGEHVGGSAVRSICFITKIYKFRGQNHVDDGYMKYPLINNGDDHCILVSVGSKQVLTSWVLRNMTLESGEAHSDDILNKSEHISTISNSEFPYMSFQWLSTHMPPKFSSSRQKVKNITEISEYGQSLASAETPKSLSAKGKKAKPKSTTSDQIENDWRYLAVTAFIVKHTDSRLTVCFVVVSCSDATVILRALLLPYRLWFDVALLVPQRSPVLALQHIVVAGHAKYEVSNRNTYIVISGSTDGSITFWDLTETVKKFMQVVLEVRPQMLIDCQKRPQTGRGSQGGRMWRSLINQFFERRTEDGSSQKSSSNYINGKGNDENLCEGPCMQESEAVNCQTCCRQFTSSTNCHKPEKLSNSLTPDLEEVKPLYILNSAHQSGVNCLHVSEIDCVDARSEKTYCVLTGGDDQALHWLCFQLEVQATKADSRNIKPDDIRKSLQNGIAPSLVKCSYFGLANDLKLRILHQDSIASAHSSAVKGIWTDGMWAFSTGLDQRVRCWQIDPSGKLKEHAHLIISVPEPESLDAVMCDRSRYQIAIAGRGMQMVEFSASKDEFDN
ncbi:uncharacterized protein [Typha latifolia]|uniref:uncharacterized protein isoform X2 n=1 Tax=Typha latifolia TaxID=4733 RepID=UPI003C2C374F